MRSQKMDHAIRSQGWAARCVDKPSSHDGRMNGKHILDIHENEAHVRSIPHHPANTEGDKVMGQR